MFVFRRSFDLILDTLVAISRQSFLLYSTASTFAVVYLVVFLLVCYEYRLPSELASPLQLW